MKVSGPADGNGFPPVGGGGWNDLPMPVIRVYLRIVYRNPPIRAIPTCVCAVPSPSVAQGSRDGAHMARGGAGGGVAGADWLGLRLCMRTRGMEAWVLELRAATGLSAVQIRGNPPAGSQAGGGKETRGKYVCERGEVGVVEGEGGSSRS